MPVWVEIDERVCPRIMREISARQWALNLSKPSPAFPAASFNSTFETFETTMPPIWLA
jgi:hypothetical protein